MSKYRRLAITTLVVLALLSVTAGIFMSQLRFDYDFESFFPENDTDREFYDSFRETFEPDNDFVLFGLVNEAGIFQKDFLVKVDSLTQRLSRLEYVESVTSPTNQEILIIPSMGGPLTTYPMLRFDQEEHYEEDSTYIYRCEHLVNTLFSETRQAVCLVMQTTANLSKVRSDSLVFAVRDVLADFEFDGLHVSGRIEGQQYFIEKMQWEMGIFISVSMVLLVIFLFITFRSLWGIWVPLLVVMLTAVWLLGFMKLTGKPIDLMVTLLPTILFVVGMSDVVHILSRYLEELRNGLAKIEALKIAFREIGMATFLTSITTAIGFLTLLTAAVKPIREFGVYTAVGVIFAFILAFSLLPALLVLFAKPKIANRTNDKLFWYSRLRRLFAWTLRHRFKVLVGGGVLVIVALIGISRIEIDNFLLEDLHDEDPHKQDFLFFEKHFSGVRPFEMAFSVGDSAETVLDREVILEVNKIEKYLKEEYGLGAIMSPVSLVKHTNMGLFGGNPDRFLVPESKRAFADIRRKIKNQDYRGPFRMYYTEDRKMGRISGKMTDDGGKLIKEKNEKLLKFIEENIDSNLVECRLTGMALLIDKNNETLASNMMNGLLIAFGIIALIMGILYRSLIIIFISLIPNMLPLLVIGGVMGFSGIDLKVSTSIIFTIAFGIAVDDTIHYMSKLRLELGKGKPLLYALKRTSISTGKAITVTTLILCSGFITLILSTFTSTYYIGLLITITLVMAVLSDLLLLPVLLILFYRRKKKD